MNLNTQSSQTKVSGKASPEKKPPEKKPPKSKASPPEKKPPQSKVSPEKKEPKGKIDKIPSYIPIYVIVLLIIAVILILTSIFILKNPSRYTTWQYFEEFKDANIVYSFDFINNPIDIDYGAKFGKVYKMLYYKQELGLSDVDCQNLFDEAFQFWRRSLSGWWDNEIGGPKNIALIMEDYPGLFPKPKWQEYVNTCWSRLNKDPFKRYGSSLIETGANLWDKFPFYFATRTHLGVQSNEDDEIFAKVAKEIQRTDYMRNVTTKGDGFYQDLGCVFHNTLPYACAYGRDEIISVEKMLKILSKYKEYRFLYEPLLERMKKEGMLYLAHASMHGYPSIVQVGRSPARNTAVAQQMNVLLMIKAYVATNISLRYNTDRYREGRWKWNGLEWLWVSSNSTELTSRPYTKLGTISIGNGTSGTGMIHLHNCSISFRALTSHSPSLGENPGSEDDIRVFEFVSNFSLYDYFEDGDIFSYLHYVNYNAHDFLCIIPGAIVPEKMEGDTTEYWWRSLYKKLVSFSMTHINGELIARMGENDTWRQIIYFDDDPIISIYQSPSIYEERRYVTICGVYLNVKLIVAPTISEETLFEDLFDNKFNTQQKFIHFTRATGEELYIDVISSEDIFIHMGEWKGFLIIWLNPTSKAFVWRKGNFSSSITPNILPFAYNENVNEPSFEKEGRLYDSYSLKHTLQVRKDDDILYQSSVTVPYSNTPSIGSERQYNFTYGGRLYVNKKFEMVRGPSSQLIQ